MRKYISFLFCFFVIFLCMETKAFADIAPLKAMPDGMEPIENSGLIIEKADITVVPIRDSQAFKFNCNYVFKGIQDSESILLGVPGDLGYTLEVGYIEDFKVLIDNVPVEYKVFTTTKDLSEQWKDYNSPLNFKWHAFQVPVVKDTLVNVSVSYNVSWRIFEQDQNRPYNIVPFTLSTDKLFGDITESVKIKYISDDLISTPDVKVMINSILQPNIISQAILSPVLSKNEKEIEWEFKDVTEFQDFRLIALSFRRLAMEFSTGTENIDNDIRWAALYDNYEKLAPLFEDIATGKIGKNLSNEQLRTAAYLSSEFYSRLREYSKAIEVLSLADRNTLLTPVKESYLRAMHLKELNEYKGLLEEYKKLALYKDYILVSNIAEEEMPGLIEIVKSEERAEAEKAAEQDRDKQRQTDTILNYLTLSLILLFISMLALLYFIYRNIKKRK